MHDNNTLREMLTPGTKVMLDINGPIFVVLFHEGEETVVGQKGWEVNTVRLPTANLNDCYVPSTAWRTKVSDLLGNV